MVASVPELTMRSFSIDGMNDLMRCAISVSIAVGAPNESPLRAASSTALSTAGWA